MKCPKCDVELQREEYESTPVFRCDKCAGYLVEKRRLSAIRGSREQSADALQREATAEHQPDSQEPVRCPRCRLKTRKERITIEPEGEEFLLDFCQECDHVWFDGGELARFQIGHEQTRQAKEMQDLQERGSSRTPEQKAAFEKHVASIPTRATWIQEIAADFIGLALACGLLILTLALWWMQKDYWSAITSLALVAFVSWRILRSIESPYSPAVTIGIVGGILGLIEAAYLIFLFLVVRGAEFAAATRLRNCCSR